MTDLTSAVSRLRGLLSVVDLPDGVYEPYVTLTHPRTASSEVANAAWAELSGWNLNENVQIEVVD